MGRLCTCRRQETIRGMLAAKFTCRCGSMRSALREDGPSQIIKDSPVVFCHFWFQCGTLRPYLTHPHVKGATPDAASNRGSRSPGDCSCGRLPGPLRESVPVSPFPELFDGPDRPGQQKPDQHYPLCAGER